MAQVQRIVSLIPLREEAKTVWHGLDSHIEHRTIYKALQITIDVADAEVPKWAALLACIAGSSALTVYLAGLAFGPVGWVGVAAAIVASTIVCFDHISPDTFKQQNGKAEVIEHAGDWHRV